MEGSAEMEMLKALNARLVYDLAAKIREVETLKQEKIWLESELEKRDLSIGTESIKRRILFSVLERKGSGVGLKSLLNCEKDGEIEALREENEKLTGELSKVLREKNLTESELAKRVEEADGWNAIVQKIEHKEELSNCEIRILNERLNRLVSRNVRLEKDVELLQEFEYTHNLSSREISTVESEKAQILKEKKAINDENKALNSKIATLEERINTLDMSFSTQINNGLLLLSEEEKGKAVAEGLYSKIERLTEENGSLRQELQVKNKLLVKHSLEKDELKSRVKAERSGMGALCKSLTRMRKELAEVRNENKEHEGHNITLGFRISELVQKLEKANLKNALLKSKVSEMEIRMREAAEKANSEIESLKEGMEGEIDSLKKKNSVIVKELERCLCDKDAMVKEMSRLLGMLERSAGVEGKRRFWAMVSSLTTAASLTIQLLSFIFVSCSGGAMMIHFEFDSGGCGASVIATTPIRSSTIAPNRTVTLEIRAVCSPVLTMEGSAEMEMLNALNARLVYDLAAKIREVETLKQEKIWLESELEKRDLSIGTESIKRRILFSVLERKGSGVGLKSPLNWEKEGEIEALREENEKLTGELSKVLREKNLTESELAHRVEEADWCKDRVQKIEQKDKLSSFEITDLRQRMNRLISRNVRLEKDNELLQEFEYTHNLSSREISAVESEKAEILKEKKAIEDENKALNAKIATLEERINALDMSLSTQINNGLLLSEEEKEKAVAEGLYSKIERLIEENGSLHKMLDSVKSELQSKNKLLEKLSLEKDELKSRVKAERSGMGALCKSLTRMRKELAEARNEMKEYQGHNITLVHQISEVDERLEKANLKNAFLKSEASEMEMRMREAALRANSEIESLKMGMEGEIDSLKKENGVIAKKLDRCLRDKDAMVKEMSELLWMLEKSAADASVIDEYGSLLSRCITSRNLKLGKAVHSNLVKTAINFNSFVVNRLIDMYSKCSSVSSARKAFDDLPFKNARSWNSMVSACSKSGMVEMARKLFDEMPEPNLVSYNSMISGLSRGGYYAEALRMFRRLQEDCVGGVCLDEFTVVSVVSCCASFRGLGLVRQLHGVGLVLGLDRNVVLLNSVVDAYGKCGEPDVSFRVFSRMNERDVVSWTSMVAAYTRASRLDDAIGLFKQMPHRNIVAWTSLMAGFAQNGQSERTLDLFKQMLEDGIAPSGFTFVTLLSACADLALLDKGKQIHGHILKSEDFRSSVYANNALLDMYCKCGDMGSSKTLFEGMVTKDVVSWNSMITGFAHNGLADESVSIFREMNTVPNHVTFLGVLSACSHTGRQNRLSEAMELVERTPVLSKHAGIWGALLGACRIHQNVGLAMKAAETLFKIEPRNPGRYVMLANVYTSAKKWSDASRVRREVEEKGLLKDVAYSRIEVRNERHEFVAKDMAHRQIQDIYEAITQLLDHMSEAGTPAFHS
ncbi:Pentatricopeptide repeat-containing protein At2g21090 [Linum grandiflorum]